MLAEADAGVPSSRAFRRCRWTCSSRVSRRGSLKSLLVPTADRSCFSLLQLVLLAFHAAVARHLDPLTLLHMSRANKMMRHVFARRASKPIWQIVRNNLGMPALEATDMTDMQLTALLFDKECRVSAVSAFRELTAWGLTL